MASIFSDSPDIPDTIDGAEMLMKGTSNSCKKPINAGITMKRLMTYPSHRMSKKRLTATWRTMKQYPTKRLNSRLQIDLWVAKRHRD